ncbi:hypothetical protein BJ508DRAFT_314311 [Ascobolus immersus RN42]|uniref:Uncharacterized protein n=1 Tax=Ascobolus immersus RN42 TaxID=1160509 RepID=A0A3N4HM20_ASCIM|nr:hypothetical protein BJ508DRAFT_314311 [Ascobolus immersus RN42]
MVALKHSIISCILLFTSICVLADESSYAGEVQEVYPESGLRFTLSPWLNSLQSTPYTLKRWTWGLIPAECYAAGAAAERYGAQPWSPYQMEVFDVTYEDCSHEPQIVCRHSKAPSSIDEIARRVGQIPVLARQHTSYFVVLSHHTGENSCTSYVTRASVVMIGHCKSMQFYLDRAAALVNHVLSIGTGENRGYSYSKEWRTVTAQGTCVPDKWYAENWDRHFAALFSMVALHGSGIDSIFSLETGLRPQDCMLDIMNLAIHKLLVEKPILKYDRNARCTGRLWRLGPVVCMGPYARSEYPVVCADLSDYDGVLLPITPKVPEAPPLPEVPTPPTPPTVPDSDGPKLPIPPTPPTPPSVPQQPSPPSPPSPPTPPTVPTGPVVPRPPQEDLERRNNERLVARSVPAAKTGVQKRAFTA